MSDSDKLRIQVLELEGRFAHFDERLAGLTVEVIRGRTEIAEKVDAIAASQIQLAERVDRLDAKVDRLDAKVDERLDALEAVLVDMPRLVVQALADAAKKGP
jgi:hypothetical protein